jgi:hypothetical protein
VSSFAAALTRDFRQRRRFLGYAGLLPFAACLAVLLSSDDRSWLEQATESMRNYAALIAAFLGAVHWGISANDRQEHQTVRLVWGVTPAVVAWFLLSLPGSVALVSFAALFTLILAVDRHLLPVLDDDYRQLRLRLSTLVIVILLVAALAAHGTSP